ncbi:MAG: cellulase family glycosylhydrolase [Bifidobacteriaceae bacterium]|nr:cellulase family glycosylhydrolase [Bifidobacteriaceae bacterium]
MSSFTANASGDTLSYSVTGATKDVSADQTPVGKHGKLSVGTADGFTAPTIIDSHGQAFQLRGASTHGVQWFPQYVNKGAFQSLRDEWGMNMVRLALYPREGGYLEGNQTQMDAKIEEGVQAATDLGMYIVIDWHVLNYNPNQTADQAEQFFRKYAEKYKSYDNVIFEICNEPTGTNWYDGSSNDLYTYCKRIATVIRDAGSDAIILCGTNTWSQDIDAVSAKPLSDDGFKNIMYTLHFYAGTHYDNIKNKLKTALAAGTPVFVSEFGICDASGNGGIDISNANDWITLLTRNNISFACWSLCNKGESASYLKTSAYSTTGGWTASDLSTTGVWLVNTNRALEDLIATAETSSSEPTTEPTTEPTAEPSTEPSEEPTTEPTTEPSEEPSTEPTTEPSTEPSEPSAPSESTATLTTHSAVYGDWGTGAIGAIELRNSTSSAWNDGWTVEFDTTGTIDNIWCAQIVSHTGNHYVVKSMSWNSTVWPGQTVNFGFILNKDASTSAAITNVTIH